MGTDKEAKGHAGADAHEAVELIRAGKAEELRSWVQALVDAPGSGLAKIVKVMVEDYNAMTALEKEERLAKKLLVRVDSQA